MKENNDDDSYSKDDAYYYIKKTTYDRIMRFNQGGETVDECINKILKQLDFYKNK